MRKLMIGASMLLTLTVASTLGGCAAITDPNYGKPYALVTYGKHALNTETIQDLQQGTIPHCEQVVKETNASPGRMGLTYGTVGFVGGVVGGAGSYKAEAAVVGAKVASKAVTAVGVGQGVATGVVNGMNGVITGHIVARANVQNCIYMEAAGYHLWGPSDVNKVITTGQPLVGHRPGERADNSDSSASASTDSSDNNPPPPPPATPQ